MKKLLTITLASAMTILSASQSFAGNYNVIKSNKSSKVNFTKPAAVEADSKFGADINLGYIRIAGDVATGLMGVGANFYYNQSEKLSIVAGLDYFLPKTIIDPIKLSAMRFNVNAQYYFVNENADDFNMFALVGGSYLMATVSGGDASESVGQLYINLGVGPEIKVGPGHVLVNAQLNLPANKANGEDIAIVLPSSILFHAGYKLSF